MNIPDRLEADEPLAGGSLPPLYNIVYCSRAAVGIGEATVDVIVQVAQRHNARHGITGNAGEVGHLRMAADGPVGYGKAGSFEGFCSGGGIAQLARRRAAEFPGPSTLKSLAPDALTARAVGEAAAAGDALALALWREVGERLGEALAVFIDVLNPERIVIGSIYQRCERFIAPAMQAVINREALAASARDCQVVPAQLGDEIGAAAAVAIAHYHAR